MKRRIDDPLHENGRMWGRLELITVAIAKAYLAKSDGNRQIRSARLAKYCADRRANRWHIHHQGIAFDGEDILRDGHHRLEMVVKTELPTEMWVMYNVPKDGLLQVDQCLPRSARDALIMASQGEYQVAMLSVTRGFLFWPSVSVPRMCPEDLLWILEEYSEGIMFASDRLKIKEPGLTPHCVRALVARAFYHSDIERLEEWCARLMDGLVEDARTDSAVITYRDLLLRLKGLSGGGVNIERYAKGQTALQAFLKRQPLSKLYGTKDDLFPVIGNTTPGGLGDVAD